MFENFVFVITLREVVGFTILGLLILVFVIAVLHSVVTDWFAKRRRNKNK